MFSYLQTHGLTDGRTDKLIWGALGNLRFLRVNIMSVTYNAQLCPIIAKGQRAPNALLTHQIFDRHHEDLKFSGPDSQTLKNPF